MHRRMDHIHKDDKSGLHIPSLSARIIAEERRKIKNVITVAKFMIDFIAAKIIVY